MLFLPDGLIEETDSTFTSAMLAYEAHIPKQYLSYVTGLLRLLGVIERLPKRQDKTWLYRVNY